MHRFSIDAIDCPCYISYPLIVKGSSKTTVNWGPFCGCSCNASVFGVYSLCLGFLETPKSWLVTACVLLILRVGQNKRGRRSVARPAAAQALLCCSWLPGKPKHAAYCKLSLRSLTSVCFKEYYFNIELCMHRCVCMHMLFRHIVNIYMIQMHAHKNMSAYIHLYVYTYTHTYT